VHRVTDRKIAVVGAGLMGAGIAQVCALAGRDVVLRDVNDDAARRGVAGIESSLGRFVAKGKIAEADAQAALHRITTTLELAETADADIVVEAIFEDVDAKRELFAALDETVRPDAVLASNTSAIPITQLAAATTRPERVVGMHFFSPVPMMTLCELVRGYKTSDETLARARAFAEDVGKTCIVVNRDVAGFVTTRLIAALANEAVRLVESGWPAPRTSTPRASSVSATRWDRWRRSTSPASTSCCTRPATSTATPASRSSRRRSCCSGWSARAIWAARAGAASTSTDLTPGARVGHLR
jgi:3-hydroxybutyryl-CoA dehydrogenase